jgi:putative ABC transport system ATP-binding protein
MRLFPYIWRNSAAEQIKILIVVVLSFPFYYISLDLPRHIISGAIQGKAFSDEKSTIDFLAFNTDISFPIFGNLLSFEGFKLDRLSYLFALAGLFLLLILVNGYFKYIINMRKGALGERLLQRLRFDLFSALLSSGPEQRQRLKPSEAASIIKDEVEPIGGFVGDAFIQPVFLGGQAMTALVFIVIQNSLLGVIAALMVLIQAVIVPRLRREQIRLGKQRQIESRSLAGKIGEVVETLSEVSNHGTAAVEQGLVARRLEALFGIRYRLYGRKFAVKALNNLLAQLTPFMFYTIGGYAALTGQLGIGQLVAVIGAYRDLPPPVKELIDWDQQRLDVETKFAQVTEQFALVGPLATADVAASGGMEFRAGGAITAQGLSLVSPTGDRMLDRVSLTLPLCRHIAVSGAGEGASSFAQLLGGWLAPSDGTLNLGGMPISAMSDDMRGRNLAYVGPEPAIFDGTLRDNILYGLRRPAADAQNPSGWTIDHMAAGAADPAMLDVRLIEVLRTVGLADRVFNYGLASKLGGGQSATLVNHIDALRRKVWAILAERGAEDVVEPYDPHTYARNATIGENVLFGVPNDAEIAGARLASQAFTRSILDELALTEDLSRMGQRIAATMLEIFRDMTPDHVLFEQFSFIGADEFLEYRERLARIDAGLGEHDDEVRFIGLAFLYSEPRHRLGLLDEAVQGRILLARHAFRARATPEMMRVIDFYDPYEYCAAAPLRENLLFGFVAHGAAGAGARADEAIHDALLAFGLEGEVFRLGLEQPAGYAGRLLFPVVKAQVALARCLIKQPAMLILNNALGSFSQTEAQAILERIRLAMKGRSLIVAGRGADAAGPMDIAVTFDGARLVSLPGQVVPAPAGLDEEADATDNAEVRALAAVPIFANLDIARIKLLAFTSERTVFAAGDVLFEQGDESDAAYVIVSGSANVLIGPEKQRVLVSQVHHHVIIGEMGIVTGDVRSATILATTELITLKLRKEVFLALMVEFPEMTFSVTRLMVKRLQDNVVTMSGRLLRESGEP